MAWGVEYTDQFGVWWEGLSAEEQGSVEASVQLLERLGPQLPHPHSTGIASSRHGRMRELRVQHGGRPCRILYAFDPRRVAVLLIGGWKQGDDRWYERMVQLADRLCDQHLTELGREGVIDERP